MEVSWDLLVSPSSAFAMATRVDYWHAFQGLVASERAGVLPADLIAERLNQWGEGGDCWRPACFQLTGMDVQALADAFSSEKECWSYFQEMVGDATSHWKPFRQELLGLEAPRPEAFRQDSTGLEDN
jgi:hypothetical protein